MDMAQITANNFFKSRVRRAARLVAEVLLDEDKVNARGKRERKNDWKE